MKKKVVVAFCILTLCLLSCLAIAKPANAQQAGYSHMCYPLQNAVTIDGKWTTTSEWTDGLPTTFGSNGVFRDKYDFSGYPTVYEDIIIETMDNTNDTGDFIMVCFDGGATAESAPSATDFAINFTGNSQCTWYQGTGTAWKQIASPSSSDLKWAESYSSSPTYSTSHLILEMQLTKTATDLGGSQILGPEFWMLIETYDAHSGGYGLQSWPPVPPSSATNPSSFGDIPYSSTAIPESMNIGVVVLLSAVAVTAGSVLIRKRSKMANLASKTNPTTS
jgi:hypothetical protein